jgi:hypothetical protein
MTSDDLVSVFMISLGLIFIISMAIYIVRYKLKVETWPRIIGFTGGVYCFVSLMIGSIINRQLSGILEYTITNVVSSLALGVMAYLSLRIIAVRSKRNKK